MVGVPLGTFYQAEEWLMDRVQKKGLAKFEIRAAENTAQAYAAFAAVAAMWAVMLVIIFLYSPEFVVEDWQLFKVAEDYYQKAELERLRQEYPDEKDLKRRETDSKNSQQRTTSAADSEEEAARDE